MENNAVIEIEKLHKAFGRQKVLDGISLKIGTAETLAILGRSGSGKSVLLKITIGLIQPDSGSIRICGKEISGLEIEAMNEIRKKIGFVFQYSALYDSLTVEENVAFPLRRHTKLSAGERSKKSKELLTRVGMEAESKKMPAE